MTEHNDTVDAMVHALKASGIRPHMHRGSMLEPICDLDTKEHDKDIVDKTVKRMKTVLEFEIDESAIIPKAFKTFMKDIIIKVDKEMQKY